VRRVGIVLCFLCLAAAGALAAGVLAGPGAALVGLTETSTTDTTDTVATTTETTVTATAPTTTATVPAPTATTPKPKPRPRPKPKPQVVRLPAGVKVGGVHVGGLAPQAALEVVRTAFRSPLRLRVGARVLPATPEQLGAVAYVKAAVARARHARPGSAVELRVVVRGGAVRSYVDSLAQRFDRDPVDSKLLLRNLAPFITKGSDGRKLDATGARAAILHALAANSRGTLRLELRSVPQAVSRANFGYVIVIRRESKRLNYYRGMRLVRAFGVAVGQSAYPTPLGRFTILVKWRNPWWYPPASPWAEGLKPVPPGPGNPLGTRWMGLSSPGVGIHGTPDDASIGYSLSHGCIRMHIPEAEWLFEHVDVGTNVFIVPD
jgi:lipoprotein-anchoring transpeptidase ErfK/SrfK